MSIVVEGMMMPECCMKCPMAVGYGCGYMRVAMTTKDMKLGRHPDCPLGEISKPKTDRDMISRQAVINAVEESRRLNYHRDRKTACAHEYEHRHFLKILMELPSAQSERKKGEWVEVSGYFTPGGDPVWKCSECGKGIHVYGIEASSYNRNYTDGHQWVACPNCGADMRGKQDGNKEEGSQIYTHQKPHS